MVEVEPKYLEQGVLSIEKDVGWESIGWVGSQSVKVFWQRHFGGRPCWVVTQELLDVQELYDEEGPVVGNGVFQYWVYVGVLGDDGGIDPDVEWSVVEEWSGVDVLEEFSVSV